MRPEVEQELAHTLLVELLAYQFASPVRWIETQDVILGEKTTERIVEIGPADTLGVMAKRTLASKYEAHDAARSVQRQILCYNKDAKDIYYDVEPEEEEAAAPAPSSAPAPAAPAAGAAPVAAAAPPPPSAGPAAQVPDAPVGAVDILRALIAQKLKKALQDIPLSKAIKDLVGGECLSFFFIPHTFCMEDCVLTLPVSQASQHFKMKSSEISEKSLDQRLKSQKTHLLMSSELPCRQLSTASSASNPHPSSPVWCHPRCLEVSTSLLSGNTSRLDGVLVQVGRTVSCFWL